MATHLHFDLVGGISGDMVVAALLDTGLDESALRDAYAGSGLPAASWDWLPDSRNRGLAGGRFVVAPESDAPRRSWGQIARLLDDASLPPRAAEIAVDVFARLAEAEAHVHGCPVEEVHFHEIGALDSIVDIVVIALLVDEIGAESFSCGPIPVCAGTVETAHGHLPLPTPAAAELLAGFDLVTITGGVETVTPTGAAVLAALCTPGAAMPPLTLDCTGTGLGTRDLPDRANMTRVLVGERVPESTSPTDAVVIEASIDDLDPRVYKSVSARLFAAGALDVTLNPVQMKKQRPGTILSVVARPADESALTTLILTETTTLGVRSWPVSRRELDRHTETAATPWGDVRIKVGTLDGVRVTATPEYDDCEIIADTAGVAVKDVIAAAAAAARLRSDLV